MEDSEAPQGVSGKRPSTRGEDIAASKSGKPMGK
jgi:hypothetical protein